MDTITISQFVEMYGDKDSIQWNYNHLDQYANKEAALQFITARANASHCTTLSVDALNRFEDSNYTDKAAKQASDECWRKAVEWHKVADSFREAMHLYADAWCDEQVDTGLTDDRPYRPVSGGDNIPF